jgi:hypothetical protein
MRVMTINELMRLTRTELCGLTAGIMAELPTYRERSPQRTVALAEHDPQARPMM